MMARARGNYFALRVRYDITSSREQYLRPSIYELTDAEHRSVQERKDVR
jgi:hypothetical protein